MADLAGTNTKILKQMDKDLYKNESSPSRKMIENTHKSALRFSKKQKVRLEKIKGRFQKMEEYIAQCLKGLEKDHSSVKFHL